MAQNIRISSVGTGIPLVFIHGWGLNSGVWKPIVESFQHQFKVITIDVPGYGVNAAEIPEVYSIENVSRCIHQAVKAETSEKAIYIGWSLGGLFATHIALNFAQSVKGLITVASTPKFKEDDNWPGIRKLVLSAFHAQLGDDVGKTLDSFLKIQAMGSPHLREDLKKIRTLVMSCNLPSRKALDEGLNLLESSDIRNNLHNVNVPFLRLYGRLDTLVPKTIPEKVKELAPCSYEYVFDKASHAPFISHQEEFCLYIRNWIVSKCS